MSSKEFSYPGQTYEPDVYDWHKKYAEQAGEIERLRAALTRIADGDARHDGAAKFMEIARAALTDERSSVPDFPTASEWLAIKRAALEETK